MCLSQYFCCPASNVRTPAPPCWHVDESHLPPPHACSRRCCLEHRNTANATTLGSRAKTTVPVGEPLDSSIFQVNTCQPTLEKASCSLLVYSFLRVDFEAMELEDGRGGTSKNGMYVWWGATNHPLQVKMLPCILRSRRFRISCPKSHSLYNKVSTASGLERISGLLKKSREEWSHSACCICPSELLFLHRLLFLLTPSSKRPGHQCQLFQAHRARELVRQVPPHAKAEKNRRHPDDSAQRAHDGGAVRPPGEAVPEVLREASANTHAGVSMRSSAVFFLEVKNTKFTPSWATS